MLTLPEVEKYLHRSLGGYFSHPRHEDAFQEGMIRAWKDMGDTEAQYVDAHILHRAKQWALAFMQTQHKVPTGHIKTSRDGMAKSQGDQTREKVVSYYNDFWELHDRKPTGEEIAQALGMSVTRVRTALRNHKEGRWNHAQYEARNDGSGWNRLASSYYSEVHFESIAASSGMDSDPMSKIGLFEDPCNVEAEVTSQRDFEILLAQVPKCHQQTLLLRFGLDMSVEDIGNTLSPESSYPRERGSQRVQRALDALKKALEPEDLIVGTCKNGHERTEENTLIITMKNGVTRRQCVPCKKDAQARYNAKKRKSEPVTNCKRGHVIDGQRKNGQRYCRTCNQQGNAARKAASRESNTNTKEEI